MNAGEVQTTVRERQGQVERRGHQEQVERREHQGLVGLRETQVRQEQAATTGWTTTSWGKR